jgi:arylsulfatase A-like enzyme
MKYVIFLSLIFCELTAVTATATAQKQNPPHSRVNILFILADDMSLSAGAYGDKTISTPGFDSIARDGVLFEHAFCTASSCTPSRASILTGRYPHELKEGANLWGTLPASYPNYTRLLAQDGYKIGVTGKGWGPGDFHPGGYKVNPAGPSFASFDKFMAGLPGNTPFCFWLGSLDPHRPYFPDLKKKYQFNINALKVPAWLPDNAIVREDLMDYYAAVKRFDQSVEHAIALLKEKGLFDNTLIIVTSDNGMPFPRIKANSYRSSTIIPLTMRWGNHFKNGSRYPEMVSLVDMAPTILDVAGVAVPGSMTGKSLLPLLLKDKRDKRFEAVYTERERHAHVRAGNAGYPIRVIQTKDFTYILNLFPDRWPAGDPDSINRLGIFADIDQGLTKKYILAHRGDTALAKIIQWDLEKRPEEELYDLKKDPNELHNVAKAPAYRKIKERLASKLNEWRIHTGDPLLNSSKDIFDEYPYYGDKYL